MKLSWANRITILRILLIVPFVSFMLKINDPDLTPGWQVAMRYLAIVIYLMMAVSDGVDGYLARRGRQVTRLGTFLDPVADKLLITAACLLLASQRAAVDGFLLPPTVVVLIIGKDLFLLIGFVIVYFITSQIRIHTVWIGKVATALQLSMVAAILIAPEVSLLVSGWIWFLRFLWWSAAGAAILATLIYIRNGSRYIEKYERNLNKRANAEKAADPGEAA
ncbi:MAG TPA: CDP-alcohol phosphatidyltransferase family protein [Sedimentisphaerales bacterium]|nr:CDP-alcohol phosphatidyltransferase family protein [Sedimentisphaerales bacterium]